MQTCQHAGPDFPIGLVGLDLWGQALRSRCVWIKKPVSIITKNKVLGGARQRKKIK